MELLQLAITGLSVVAAILAWIAKIRWSKEYSDAKEATIAAKDAQIQVLEKQIEELRDLTPMKLREYLRSSQELLEEHIDNLKREVEEVKTESKAKDERIRYLSAAGHQKENELTVTIMEKEELNQRVADLEEEINKLKTVSEEVTTASVSLDKLDLNQNLKQWLIVRDKTVRINYKQSTQADFYRKVKERRESLLKAKDDE